MFDDIIDSKKVLKIKDAGEDNILTIAKARAFMWQQFCNDEDLWMGYQANVAVYLQDRYGMTHDDSNDAAQDLLELIFT